LTGEKVYVGPSANAGAGSNTDAIARLLDKNACKNCLLMATPSKLGAEAKRGSNSGKHFIRVSAACVAFATGSCHSVHPCHRQAVQTQCAMLFCRHNQKLQHWQH
jgi:hypothetical protein